jgi:phospholipid/cholesterol/gamma-HCH transport system substrate-binding protein
MERNANYALVGLISTILLIAMIVFIFWLANFALSAKYQTYHVQFNGAVDGLTRGGDVQFNGIKVGEVTDIELDPNDPNRVVADISIRQETPVHVDSTASLNPQGITGVNYIGITPGSKTSPLLRDNPNATNPPMTIKATPGGLSSLLAGGGTLLTQASQTLTNINKVLSDQNVQKVDGILSDVQAVTTELRERKQIIADADNALRNADQAAQQIRKLGLSATNLVDTQGKPTMTKIQAAVDQINGTAADLRAMIAKLQGPTSDFAANGLPQLTRELTELQTTTQNLNRLITEVERDPRAFINKPQAQQIPVKP